MSKGLSAPPHGDKCSLLFELHSPPSAVDDTAPPSPTVAATSGDVTSSSFPGAKKNAQHDFSLLPDPKGTSSNGVLTVVKNNSNNAFLVMALVFASASVVEAFMLHQKLNVNEKATVEVIAIAWSVIIVFSCLAMYQTFELRVDTISGAVMYVTRRAFLFKTQQVLFQTSQLRAIVVQGTVTRADARAQNQFRDGNDRQCLRHSISLSVDVTAYAGENVHHLSPSPKQQRSTNNGAETSWLNLTVDYVVGADAASEEGKRWLGLFQRLIGSNSAIAFAASPHVSTSVAQF